jgi:hypothetical protein
MLRTLGAVTAFISAVAALLAALTAAGLLGGDDEGSPTTLATAAAPTTGPTTASEPVVTTAATSPPPTAAPRAQVTLFYPGDLEGCGLSIEVTIGDRSFLPIGTSYVAQDVQSGLQRYGVQGTIVCPLSGQCQASGTGTVDVAEGRTFTVGWVVSAFAACTVTLSQT